MLYNKIMKSYKIIIIVLLLFLPTISYGWSYPFKSISVIACKFTHWTKHDEECKRPLPIIEGANYKKHKDDIIMRLTYSVLWLSTYTNWWDVWYWSHLWVDIATAQWTPVYAIWDWEVIISSFLAWWWRTVVIKHKIKDKYIYSVYAHLDKNEAKLWSVKEWDKIWEVWNTGNSYWNHLHFQIDINQKWTHPYYHTKCKWSSDIIVDWWLCKTDVIANTIDPIEFLETNWANIELEKIEEIETDNIQHIEEQKISPKDIIPRKQLMLSELEFFLAKYKPSVESKIKSNLIEPWKSWTININVTYGKNNKPYTWIMPMPIEIIFDKDMIDLKPTIVKYLEKWVREIPIKALKSWNTLIIFKIWWKIIWREKIRISDKDENAQVSKANIILLWTQYIGSENRWLITMKDNFNYNIINIPYKGTYSVQDWTNSSLCPIEINSISELKKIEKLICTKDKQTDKFEFDYENSLKWLILFKLVTNEKWKIMVDVYDDKWKRIWWNRLKEAVIPQDMQNNKQHPYYDIIMEWFKKGIITNKKWWNFAPDFNLLESDAIIWIKNSFTFAKDISGSKSKYITRIEFMKLINEMTGIVAKNIEKSFWDINWEYMLYSNILIDYWIKFRDQFADKYFQPDKKITRKEATDILVNMTK